MKIAKKVQSFGLVKQAVPQAKIKGPLHVSLDACLLRKSDTKELEPMTERMRCIPVKRDTAVRPKLAKVCPPPRKALLLFLLLFCSVMAKAEDFGAVVAAVQLLQQTVAMDDALEYAVLTDTFKNATEQLQTAQKIYQTAVDTYNNAVQQYNELLYHTRIMGDPKNIGSVLNSGIFNQNFQDTVESIRGSGGAGEVYDSGNESRSTLYGSADPTSIDQMKSADPLAKYRELDSRVDKYNAIETQSRQNLKENQAELKRLMDALAQAGSGAGAMDQSKIMAIQAEMTGLLIKMQADQSKLDAAKQDIESAEKERANNMERMSQLYENKREEIKKESFEDMGKRKIDLEQTRKNAFGNTSNW